MAPFSPKKEEEQIDSSKEDFYCLTHTFLPYPREPSSQEKRESLKVFSLLRS